MRFSVIIATLGRRQGLARTLAGVARCDPLPDEIVVVDGDPQESSRIATTGDLPLEIRYLTSQPGLPRQRNVGIDAARGDVLVFIDDDVDVPIDTFSILARVYEDGSIVGATARIVEPQTERIGKKHSPARRYLPGGGPEGTFTRYGYPRRLIDLDTERDISFMHGSFMTARAETARAVRFDEVLPGYALAEDEDFSYRISEKGRVRFVPALEVFHDKEGHGSRGARRFGRTVVVNRAYLFRKNFERTARARFQFAMLVALLIGHRLINREFAEALGLVEGSFMALNNPLVRAARKQTRSDVRVAFVSSHAREGGSERYIVELMKNLGAGGPLWCLEDGPLVSEMRAASRDVRVIPSTGRPLSIVRAAMRLGKEMKAEAPTVVHANGVKAALACAIGVRRTPVVWVKHDFSFDGPLVRFIASRCAAIVGVSEACLAALSDKQRGRATVIHTGVHTKDVDRGDARRKLVADLGLEETDRLVGLVGRLHPVKGHLDLIEAGTQLDPAREGLQFVFVGGDDPSFPQHAKRIRQAAAALGDRVHLLGHRDDVAEVMAGLDLGVVPSNRNGGATVEALPLVALEMMAVGTPVVAYPVGGIPEALGDCGVQVMTGDIEELAHTIATTASDAVELGRLSACGKKRVRERFSVSQMVEAMRAVYAEVSR